MAVKHTSWPERPKEKESKKPEEIKEEVIPQIAVVATPPKKKKQHYKTITLSDE